MQSDPDVTQALLPLVQGASRVTYGNLLTLPVTGGLMYVQPIYATRQLSDASYPILRYVTVSYGDEVGIGNTLERAIIDVLGGTSRRPTTATDNPPNTDDGGNIPTRVRNLLAQAEDAFQAADRAFADGKVGQWATLVEEGRSKVDEAIRSSNGAVAPTRTNSSRRPPSSHRPSIWAVHGRGVTLRSPTRGGAVR